MLSDGVPLIQPACGLRLINDSLHSMPCMVLELESAWMNRSMHGVSDLTTELLSIIQRTVETDPEPALSFAFSGGLAVIASILIDCADTRLSASIVRAFRVIQDSLDPRAPHISHQHQPGSYRDVMAALMVVAREVSFSANQCDCATLEESALFIPALLKLAADKQLIEAAVALSEEVIALRSGSLGSAVPEPSEPLAVATPSSAVAALSMSSTQMLLARNQTAELAHACADLSAVPELVQTLDTMQPRSLGFACRVLSLLVYDGRDRLESIHLSAVGSKAVIDAGRLTRNAVCQPGSRNQAWLLRHESGLILKRVTFLVHYLSRHECRAVVEFRGDPQELLLESMMFHNAFRGESQVARDANTWQAIESASRSTGVTRTNGHGNSGGGRASMEMQPHQLLPIDILLASHQVEILFILTMLLGGKRRRLAVQVLHKFGVVDALLSLFNSIDWDPRHEPPPTPHPSHGPNCNCNPASAFKMQLLRTILCFLDRDSHSREIKSAPVVRQLLRRLVAEMCAQPADSNYRFWMLSSLEAFLRGAPQDDQTFVGQELGLIQILVRDISADGFKCTGALQTAFDVLGECVKVNAPNIQHLESLLLLSTAHSPPLLRMFVDSIFSNLVDSNVFLRSLLLSADYSTVLTAELLKGERLLKLLNSICMQVSASTVTQENICCVNTALLFFVLAEQLGFGSAAAMFVQQLEPATQKNLASIVDFWRRYYLVRGKDCFSLEFSTRVHISHWRLAADSIAAVAKNLGLLCD